jgi:hypothetical protein
MQSMMQFRRDTQAAGRFFPQGSRVQVIDAGDSCLVLPDAGAHTTLSAVPAKSLARLTLLHVALVNHRVGLIDEQERWALDADDIRSTIDLCAPDFEILELNESSS